jgi:hypothetical protein
VRRSDRHRRREISDRACHIDDFNHQQQTGDDQRQRQQAAGGCEHTHQPIHSGAFSERGKQMAFRRRARLR